MAITRLLRHDGIGETLVAGFEGEAPVALHAELWGMPARLRLGQVTEARLTARSEDGRGAFLETELGDAYMEPGPAKTASLGTRLAVQVVSEARDTKLARVKPVKEPHAQAHDPVAAWTRSLPLAEKCEGVEAGEPGMLHGVLAAALSPRIVLAGGGHLTLARTQAMATADIDTAGRTSRGGKRPADRAIDINREAAGALADALALRSLGGLVVLDCVGPVAAPHKPLIKRAFLDRFRSVCRRRAEALAPSPFGLMEIALAWGARPIDETYLDAAGTPTPRAVLQQGLRDLEREARAARAATLRLALPESAYAVFAANAALYMDALGARYGARFAIAPHTRPHPEVSHADETHLPGL